VEIIQFFGALNVQVRFTMPMFMSVELLDIVVGNLLREIKLLKLVVDD
jgi:hypothetical protein